MPDCAAICLTISSFVASSGTTGEDTPATETVGTVAVGGKDDCELLGKTTGVLNASCNNEITQKTVFTEKVAKHFHDKRNIIPLLVEE